MNTPSLANRTAVAAALAALIGGGGAADAAQLTAAYVFYSWTAPANVSAPPFTFNGGTSGYQLTLDSNGVATAATALSQSIVQIVTTPLTYSNHLGTIDAGETQTAAYRNSEVGIWDDAGIINEGLTDARLNIDFGTSVWFTIPTGGYTGLIVAEDAGLDSFRLTLTSTNADTGGTPVFNGFTTTLANTLIATPQFSGLDTGIASEMDQVFLFLFDGPISGFARIDALTNYGGEALEIDFIGTVPLPPAVWLFGSALMGLTMLGRRRKGQALGA